MYVYALRNQIITCDSCSDPLNLDFIFSVSAIATGMVSGAWLAENVCTDCCEKESLFLVNIPDIGLYLLIWKDTCKYLNGDISTLQKMTPCLKLHVKQAE